MLPLWWKDAKVAGEQKVKLNGCEGREWKVTSASQGDGTARAYLVGNRVVVFGAGGKPGKAPPAADVERFFGSIKLTK